jgi:NitT/TauT family transport system permease protein
MGLLNRLSAPIILLFVWEAAVRYFEVPNWLLPAPSRIAVTAWEWRVKVFEAFLVTLLETLEGFGLAILIGVPLAIALVISPALWRSLDPLLGGLQAVPKNAIAPLFIVWFGAGEISKVAITFLISFFPIVVNTASGMRTTDVEMLQLMRSMRATTLQTFIHARLPNSLPYFFAACKVSITLALVGAVIGEFVGSDNGLGYLILIASSQLKTDLAFVSIVILAAAGMVLFWAVEAVEEVVVPWANRDDQGPVL